MKKLLAIFLCLFLAFPVNAKIVAKSQGTQGSILLTDDKCEGTPFFKLEARNHKNEVVITGCWFLHKTTVVALGDEGQVGTFELDVFDWNPSI